MLENAKGDESYPELLQAANKRRRPKFFAAIKLELCNAELIKNIYTSDVTSEIRREVRRRALAICSDSSQLQLSWTRNGLLVRVRGENKDAADREAERILKDFFVKICALPIGTRMGLMVPFLSACMLEIVGDASGHVEVHPGAGEFSPNFEPSRDWSRLDMMRAATLFDALSKGNVSLETQKVSVAPGSDNLLYQDCSFMISHPDLGSRWVSLSSFDSSLQKLGLTNLAEAMLLEKVVGTLRRNDDLVLGYRLGWSSIKEDFCLQMILKDLAKEPSVSRRLIVELAGIGKFAPDVAIALVEEFRKSGTKIALADFGDILYPIDFVTKCTPDIIKINSRKQWKLKEHPVILQRLADLARAFAPHVVIHNIDTEADLQAARAAGVTWQQGDYINKPLRIQDATKIKLVNAMVPFVTIEPRYTPRDRETSIGGAYGTEGIDSWRVSGGMS